ERGRTPLIGAFLARDTESTLNSSKDAIKNEDTESAKDQQAGPIPDTLPFYPVGTLCTIVSALPTGGGAPLTLVVYPHYRIKADFEALNDTIANNDTSADSELSSSPSSQVSQSPRTQASMTLRVRLLEPLHIGATGSERALAQECITLLSSLAKSNAFIREHLASFTQPLPSVDEPEALTDLIAVLCSGPPQSLQRILASESMEERLRIALELLLRESESTQLLIDIRRSVEERLSSRHREALLQEQLRAIQRELGNANSNSRPTGESLRERAISLFESRIAPLRAKIIAESPTVTPLSTPSAPVEPLSQPTSPVTFSSLLAPSIPALLQLIDEEMERLASVEVSSGEFGIIRTYLDWLTALPWLSSPAKNTPSLEEARTILDTDHWGLADVKQRIIEMLASIRLQGQSSAVGTNSSRSVLLLVGPPGIGKTSIAASVARALGRPFYRLSLGGLADVAEIKGHRRTYLGAMPGKLIQALLQTQSHAPVILLDEIDKVGMATMGGRVGGDPGAALLEVLDGRHFVDYFLDTPVDLSGVIFVATANQTDSISAPLLDRMSIIRLSSYVTEEKIAIAKRHLLPQALSSTGLGHVHVIGSESPISVDENATCSDQVDKTMPGASDQLSPDNKKKSSVEVCLSPKTSECVIEFPEATLRTLIDNWCREPGVRQLRQSIERICRRIAATILEHPGAAFDAALSSLYIKGRSVMTKMTTENTVSISSPIRIGVEALPQLLGLAPFSSELSDFGSKSLPPGVVAGLAWTPYGGAIIHIEVIRINETENTSGSEKENDLVHSSLALPLKTTGHLGKVMDESAAIAHSVVRMALAADSQTSLEAIPAKTGSHGTLHLHVPEGATPKDGPSAGVAMAVALLSLARNVPVRAGLGFTGELTLSGRILRIGGLREKALAARREGLTAIAFPRANIPEWEEMECAKPEPLVGPSVGLVGFPVSSLQEVLPIAFPKTSSPTA
ncbi:mitochondrial Lon protease, partial [Mitosporidium daphniae]